MPYKTDYILQKRRMILRSLLIVATPYETRCVTLMHITQPIADRVAQQFESISQTFSTNQNSAHGFTITAKKYMVNLESWYAWY